MTNTRATLIASTIIGIVATSGDQRRNDELKDSTYEN
jgi:hypothetical protein